MTSARQPPGLGEVADQLHSAALHLVRAVRTEDVAMGLSPARASAMSVLVFGGPRTVGELAAAEGVASPTMSQLVNGLESTGLARRRPGIGDQRRVLVEATEEGQALLREGRRRRVALLEALLADLGSDDLAVLDRAAQLMEAAVERHLPVTVGSDRGHAGRRWAPRALSR